MNLGILMHGLYVHFFIYMKIIILTLKLYKYRTFIVEFCFISFVNAFHCWCFEIHEYYCVVRHSFSRCLYHCQVCFEFRRGVARRRRQIHRLFQLGHQHVCEYSYHDVCILNAHANVSRVARVETTNAKAYYQHRAGSHCHLWCALCCCWSVWIFNFFRFNTFKYIGIKKFFKKKLKKFITSNYNASLLHFFSLLYRSIIMKIF